MVESCDFDGTDRYIQWRAERKLRLVHVYVISCGQFVKIGIAADVPQRRIDLQVGNPIRLGIAFISPGMTRSRAAKVEYKACQLLDGRHRSGEWFECSIEDAVSAIAQARKQ